MNNCRLLNAVTGAIVLLLILMLFDPSAGAAASGAFDHAVISGKLYKAASDGTIKVSVSYDQGQTFSMKRSIASPEAACQFIKLIDDAGSVRIYWIENNKLRLSSSSDGLLTWSLPLDLYKFDKTPSDAKLAYNPKERVLNVIWSDNLNNIFSCRITDDVFSNSPSRQMNSYKTGGIFSLDSSDNYICLAFFNPQTNALVAVETSDSGYSWKKTVAAPGVPSDPFLIKVRLNRSTVNIAFILKDTGNNNILITSKASNEASWKPAKQVVSDFRNMESFDLSAPDRDTLFLSIRTGSELLVKRSFDSGASWKTSNNYMLPYSADSMTAFRLLTARDAFIAVLGKDSIFISDEKLRTVPDLSTGDDAAFPTSEVSIELIAFPGIKNLQCSLDIGPDADFTSGTFRTLEPSGLTFKTSAGLKDGKYYYRASLRNGVSITFSKVRSLTIDTERPFLDVVSPADASAGEISEISASGSTEPDASFSINKKKISLASSGRFDAKIDLKAGINILTFESTDRAGNTSSVSRKIFFAPPGNKIILVKPGGKDWVKPGSAIAVEAGLTDGSSIDEGQEAVISFNGSTLESSLVYDALSDRISGFAILPVLLLNGKNTFVIGINGSDGKEIKDKIEINADAKEPSIGLAVAGGKVHSNRTDAVVIPLSDDGSGPDLANSKVRLFSGSSTVETKTSCNRDTSSVILVPQTSLKDGIYTLDITPRDLCGNTGPAKKYAYIVDTRAPELALESETPAKTYFSSILLSGKTDKPYLSSVSVTVNGKPVKTVSIRDNSFRSTVDLDSGDNNIFVTACDLAGNKVSLSRTVFFSAAPETIIYNFDGINIGSGDYVPSASSLKITDASGNAVTGATVKIDGTAVSYNTTTGYVSTAAFSNGPHTILVEAPGKTYETSFNVSSDMAISAFTPCPNPFDPSKENICFSFNASKSSTVTVLVFDIKGSLVYKSEFLASTGFNSGLNWNGKNSAGEDLPNGIYLVNLIGRDAAGASSGAKGKAVLLR